MKPLQTLCAIVALVFVFPLALSGVVRAEPLKVVHPPPESNTDQRHTYYWRLLKAALEANRDEYGDFTLSAYPTPMNFQRALAEVESGSGRVNIVARATSSELEERLRAIPLPLDKGVLGYRVALTTPAMVERLAKVRNLDDLRRFSIGQGSPWADVPILRAAGFNLVLTESYEPLFAMLSAGRFDLFLRGVNEVEAEWAERVKKYPNLVIDPYILLAYPMPRFFFVSRTEEGERLAKRIEDGLLRIARNGQFDKMYKAYKREVLGNLDLSGRLVLRIPNPELSVQAPKDKFWWDDLEEELRPGVGRKR